MCPIIGYNGTNIVPIIGQISRVDLYENFQGQVCQGPICQSPTCRDPICKVQLTSKKCPRPDLPRILRIVRPFACLSVLKKISHSFFSSSFAFFGQSCQRHHPHHPLTNITPGCGFLLQVCFWLGLTENLGFRVWFG